MKNKRLLDAVLKIIFILIILIVFALLFLRYYSGKINFNPDYVHLNYRHLERQASHIQSSYGLENKSAKCVFVLTYHAITKKPTNNNLRTSYNQFKDMMFTLKKEGYQTISLSDFYSFMKGEKSLPDKSFLLTFDDGAKLSYYNGDPILKALNYSAVFFIITNHSVNASASRYYMSEEELKSAYETGRWELASHTDQGHFRLPIDSQGDIAPALTNKLWIQSENRLETDQEFYDRVSKDLLVSKEKLENITGKPIIAFALPYGDFGERDSNYPDVNNVLVNLTTSDYELVFYEFPYKFSMYRCNYNDNPLQQSFIISRMPSDELSKTPERLLQLIDASRPLSLPYLEEYNNSNRWVRINGEATFNRDSIELYPGSGNNISTSSTITSYVDGSYLLKDYLFSVQLDDLEALSISLISRYKNTNDFVSCAYKGNKVSIMSTQKNLPSETLISGTIQDNNISPGSKISMSVLGNKVSCFFEDNLIVFNETTSVQAYGGVGIKIDNSPNQNVSLTFGNISIIPI